MRKLARFALGAWLMGSLVGVASASTLPTTRPSAEATSPEQLAAPKSTRVRTQDPAETVVSPAALVPAASKLSVPKSYESDIRAFEALDKANPPSFGGVLFYGSSSIRLWSSLSDDFAGVEVTNRGFGGSTAADALKYAERVVLPRKPSTIIFYEGDNDLGAGRPPEAILADFKGFVHIVHDALPRTKIFILSVKPSPFRETLLDTQRRTNSMVRSWIENAQDPNLQFVDVFSAMLDPDGKPRADLFGPDHLHMNHEGYKIWAKVIDLKPIAAASATASKIKQKVVSTVSFDRKRSVAAPQKAN